MTFGTRLDAAIRERGPLCIGIDPHAALLGAWNLPDSAAGVEKFALTCVEAFANDTAVVKPQSAFFERFGSAGIAALERAVREARAAGALVLLDVKRGDIGSTMAAYADAYLDPSSPLAVDAITITPYLGVGALQPAFDLVARYDVGAFVVTLTSNKEGQDVQLAHAADGRTIGQLVVDEVAEHNVGAEPLGSLGLVVGATIGDLGVDLAKLNGPILAPGVGTQGGTADDVRRIFGDARGVLPSVSRDVLRAGPSVATLRDAARRYRDQFAS
ncbi:MAG TPA: orotidine-5'-phosphate decarboxylase [Jatrophihabitantaceae bacterium]|nr:orotidine-5'-phosphate decarboxylase [Jatrophihabitantaceae bacterium]